MTLKRVAVFVLRPILLIFGPVIGGAYKLIFGWWVDERSDRNREENFKEDLQAKVPALFTKLDGKFIPNDRKYPRAFDYVVVSVLCRRWYSDSFGAEKISGSTWPRKLVRANGVKHQRS
jgi:hypothetical protein